MIGAVLAHEPLLTVVIATRDRHQRLEHAISTLARQQLAAPWEIVVVDDGSNPPVTAPNVNVVVTTRVIRTLGLERSAARNQGAAEARGAVLVFIDDDIEVGQGFVAAHRAAHAEWPDCLAVGAIRLSKAAGPFVQFRQALEDAAVPRVRGPVTSRTFCTAANMSIRRETFLSLGGFDPLLASSEDQDLALRVTASGRRIVFVPEARAVHHDSAMDIAAYCRRVEWGAEHLGPFLRKHPDLDENRDRIATNGPLRLRDRPSVLARKLLKSAVAPAPRAVFAACRALESVPAGRIRTAAYRLAIGVHLQRGLRRALRTAAR